MFTKKRIIWILSIIVAVALIGGVVAKKQGWIGKAEETKVATEKVAKRTIVEVVSASPMQDAIGTLETGPPDKSP